MSAIVGSSFAQMALEPATTHVSDRLYPAKPTTNLNKALGTEFWSDDFSVAATWTIDNDGQTDADKGWTIGTTNNSNFFPTAITSTSGGNYAQVKNGDGSATSVVGAVYTMTTTAPIDVATLAGSNSAILKFQQYGARFNDLQEVQISTNGTAFTTVYDNQDLPILSQTSNFTYPNPMDISVNISTAIAANPSTVWIRFSWTSNFPQSTAQGAWFTYGWFIDDVRLETLSDNDLVVTDTRWGAGSNTFGLVEYSKIPTSQVSEMAFVADVNNEGANDAKNATLAIDINSGLFTSSFVADSIVAGTIDTLLITDPTFTPPATVASYTVDWMLTSDSTDDVPVNNMIASSNFDVTEFIYSRDNGVVDGSIDFGADNPVEFGNHFTAYAATDLQAIDFVVGSGSDAGAEVLVHLYEVSVIGGALSYNKVASSSIEYTLTSADVGTNAKVSVKLDAPYTLVAGMDYVASVEGYGGAGTAFAVASSGTHSGFFSENGDDFGFFGDVHPMIDMNFENVLVTTAEGSSNATPVCIGDVFNFTSNTTGGVAPYTFSWNYGDGTTSTLANDTHAFASAGQKTVTFTVTDAAAGSATETFNVIVGNCFTSIEENSLNGVLVSQNMPNPFNGSSLVNFELASSEVVTFEILDVAGKLVRTMNLGNLNSGAHSIVIDAEDLNSGVYYYSIITSNSKVTNKMVVQK